MNRSGAKLTVSFPFPLAMSLLLAMVPAGCGGGADDTSSSDRGSIETEATDSTSESATSEDSQQVASSDERASSAEGSAKDSKPAAKNRKPSVPQRSRTTGGRFDITFDDLKLELPAGALFRDEVLTERVKELDQNRVKLSGFIHAGSIFQQKGISEFVFVMNPECKFGPDGEAFCVVLVQLAEGQTTDFTLKPFAVEGDLAVDPFNQDGVTWSVYRITNGKVTK